MIAEIITVGSEILIGDILNTNSRYLSKNLSEIGLDVFWHSSVGDNEKRIVIALDVALKRSDVVIFTGGLGSTKDDITKEIVAKYLKKDLLQDENLKANMQQRFRFMGIKPSENNYKQCSVIEGAKIFENKNGMAPAMAVKYNDKLILLLPGPPNELVPLFEDYIKPYILSFTKFKILSKNVNIYGLPESEVDELVSDILMQKNPTVGIYAKDGEVRLRVTAKAENEKLCEEMIDRVIEYIKKRLKGFIYGIDVFNMQTALVKILNSKNKTISTAESCTGGLIASSIVEISGSSRCFKMGVVCYCNTAKQKFLGVDEQILKKYGAVSSHVAKQMAFGVRRLSSSDIGISTTGIAGPCGGTIYKPVGLVYVGISTKNDTKAYRLFLGNREQNERNKIRHLASLFAMNKVRQLLS